MNIPSEFKSVTDYAVICGKRCQLFENFLRGRKLKNFEDCLYNCAEHVKDNIYKLQIDKSDE
ncbi:unnamed protein product (macronuclear) [Paramecium tetraurelia]|uniref:Tim10-like domain-containing protein n=1 Tax=Paramecium tetraurelia TaxID=5888 RepID=A0CNH7_PARTE|nr:uncharacterized protein GSPATT00008786001 [Paramecium tetraurelia]CAK72344.1 unnamed protein product [Paramecium tetraurelia]|eukprot:XP_001439741.1 hypothetical protein (macronuclear) [Paramecium tetraurelia strain d4-2]